MLSDAIRAKPSPSPLRLLPGADVDVVQDLEMVGEELDGRDEDRPSASAASPAQA